jgi:hypothetical protein
MHIRFQQEESQMSQRFISDVAVAIAGVRSLTG